MKHQPLFRVCHKEWNVLFVLRCSYVNDQFLHGGRDPHDRPVQTITLGIPSLFGPNIALFPGKDSVIRIIKIYNIEYAYNAVVLCWHKKAN